MLIVTPIFPYIVVTKLFVSFHAITLISFMSDVMKREVGLIIREARKRKSLTQKELAERIGVTKTIITNYEAGRQNLTIDTLQKVADALGAELKISIV